jgi:hypothetical protein
MIRLRRNSKGNQLAEFGPAVILLVLVIMVPMVVLIYVGMGFGCGWYLNFMSVRAAATVPEAQLQSALDAQQAAWTASGFPAFACATVLSNAGPDGTVGSIRYNVDTDLDLTLVDPANPQSGVRQPVELDDFVRVVTVVQITPVVQLPFLPLSPWQFTYSSERPIEEADAER